MGFPPPPPGTSRDQIRETGLGHITATSAAVGISTNLALVAQALRGTGLGLRAGDIVTNIIVLVQTIASGTPGVVYAGLLDSNYNRLVISADVNTLLTTLGQAVLPLTAPYTVPTDGLYFPVILMATAYGSTQPSLIAGGLAGISGAIAGKPQPTFVQTGQATIPTTATPAATSGAPWFAVS